MKSMILRPFFLAACAAAALVSTGCEGPYQPVSNPSSLETAGVPAVLLDEDLQDVVAVDLIRTGPNPNGFLTVQANIRNRTDHDVAVQAQVLFYDRSGVLLYSEPGNQTPWTGLTLTANETQPYRSQALTKAAYRFTVRVRFMNRHR